ncbi:MAG: mechanosensitive ion channel family protein [Dehalococcoidia bacterium]|nr:mechanosensitive ion channel family protein [Dehalococcoidia bacterium]
MLSKFLINIGYVTIFAISIFMILSELGIDIGPMLAAAGVVGIAVGLGSQKLIGDLINGTFIMLEDYYSIGDVVQVAGLSGQVEEVSIRSTILRDLDGVVHIIPNGEVKIASNFTRNWSRVNINIPVSYNENLDKVISVLNKVGMQLSKDKHYGNMIITPPQVLRVDNFGDSAIEIKMLGETKPVKQWDVAGELRKRIKEAFDEENIEIPWPHTKVYFANTLNTKGEEPFHEHIP